MEMTCFNHPNESHVNGDEYYFKCGAQLVEKSRCKCGRDIQLFYAYCPRCGKIVERKEK
jgi:hypothetical protein